MAHEAACERRVKLRKLSRYAYVRDFVTVGSYMVGHSSRSPAGCARNDLRSWSITKRSTSSPTRPKAKRSSCGDTCRSIGPDVGHMTCKAQAWPTVQHRNQHPAAPGCGRRSQAVRVLGMRPDPIPEEVRKCQRDIAGRTSQPLCNLLRNNDRNSRPVMEGLVRDLRALPHLALRSITFNRGTESTDGLTCKRILAPNPGFVILNRRGKRNRQKQQRPRAQNS